MWILFCRKIVEVLWNRCAPMSDLVKAGKVESTYMSCMLFYICVHL